MRLLKKRNTAQTDQTSGWRTQSATSATTGDTARTTPIRTVSMPRRLPTDPAPKRTCHPDHPNRGTSAPHQLHPRPLNAQEVLRCGTEVASKRVHEPQRSIENLHPGGAQAQGRPSRTSRCAAPGRGVDGVARPGLPSAVDLPAGVAEPVPGRPSWRVTRTSTSGWLAVVRDGHARETSDGPSRSGTQMACRHPSASRFSPDLRPQPCVDRAVGGDGRACRAVPGRGSLLASWCETGSGADRRSESARRPPRRVVRRFVLSGVGKRFP